MALLISPSVGHPTIGAWPETLLARLVGNTRRNHALEHATIHLLSQRRPSARLMGRSTAHGYYLYGEVPTEDVVAAANDALARLQAGHSGLAVHPRCGTNLVVGSLLAGLATSLVFSRKNRSLWDSLPAAILAASLALYIAQPLGILTQQRVTTDARVAQVRIAGVSRRMGAGKCVHFLATEHAPTHAEHA